MKKIMVALMMIAISFNIQGISATQEEIDNARDTALGYLGFTVDSELSNDIINDAVKEKKDKILNELIKNDPAASDHKIATSFYDYDVQLNVIEAALIVILSYSGERSHNFQESVRALLKETQYLDPKYYASYNASVMSNNASVMSKNSLSDAERFAEENFRKSMIEVMRSDVSERQKEIDATREIDKER